MLLVLLLSCGGYGSRGKAIRMPASSYQGPLPPLTTQQRVAAAALRAHVQMLAGQIGERNHARPKALAQAAEYLVGVLGGIGSNVRRLPYTFGKKTAENLELTLPGSDRAAEIVVIGAHYDSVGGSPGANDNASGVAAALVLARDLRGVPHRRTLRFVLFADEEPPYFQTDHMGSLVYARACRARGDQIVAMLSLETLGYYSNARDSQRYPPLVGVLFPDQGNFVGFVSNGDSRPLLFRAIASFREHAAFPSEGAALSASLPGIGWSDHWSFWQVDYPAIMVTDTAPFRYPHYHTRQDTPDRLDYGRFARVVIGLEAVVRQLSNE
jgi:hypothetical protein